MTQRGQRLLRAAIVVGVVGICVGLVWAGVGKLAAAKAQLKAIEEANARLDEQNRRLYRRLQRLRHDPQAIERACRYQMGWVGPGEVVYVMEGEDAFKGR